MKYFLDYINNQKVISDKYTIREAFDGVLSVQSKTTDGVNDVLTEFEYQPVTIDPQDWKDMKKKGIADNTVAGAAKRIIRTYLKSLNTYYTNQVITLLHGANYTYPETSDTSFREALDNKAFNALSAFKKDQYAKLLDRQSLMKSRAADLHKFLSKVIDEAISKEDGRCLQFYVCKNGTLGTTMLIIATKETPEGDPFFYYITDGLNIQEY